MSVDVTLKVACTLDGKIATKMGMSQWITGLHARQEAHQIRNRHDAILVGVQTVIQDNPRLDTRNIHQGKSPVRIILDSQGRSPENSLCFRNDGVKVLWVVGQSCSLRKFGSLKKSNPNVTILHAPDPRPEPEWLVSILPQYGIQSLLVEGGSSIFASFIRANMAHHLVLFIAPKIIGGQDSLTWCGELECLTLDQASLLRISSVRMVGEDIMIHADFNMRNHE
ncbi:MAG: RibD family protein [SAR324 cluster bacterium]|nr:RibD family protein [SAR324 cluster bacterium]